MSAREVPFRRSTVVLYEWRDVVVTDAVMTCGGSRYDIADIQALRQGSGSVHPGVWAALSAAAGEAIILGLAAAASGSPIVWGVVIVALAIPCGVAAQYAVRWPRELILFASYKGRWVALHDTRDRDEFGKVARALRRAMELNRRLPE